MATCKECLHFDVCVAFMYSEIDICKTLDECKEKHANDEVCDLFMPAADVVPRAEVEKLVQEKDDLIKNYAECMKDYAREIFEEIDNALHDMAMEYHKAGHPEYFAVCEMVHHKVMRPIEKKYIGDKQRKEDEGK